MHSDHHRDTAPAVPDPDLPHKVMAGLNVGVYLTNDREQIIAVNPRGEELLGRSASAVIGHNAHDLLHRGPEGSCCRARSAG